MDLKECNFTVQWRIFPITLLIVLVQNFEKLKQSHFKTFMFHVVSDKWRVNKLRINTPYSLTSSIWRKMGVLHLFTLSHLLILTITNLMIRFNSVRTMKVHRIVWEALYLFLNMGSVHYFLKWVTKNSNPLTFLKERSIFFSHLILKKNL